MNQAENPYRQDVFLENLRKEKNRQQQRIWAEHQQMQLSFLRRHGFKSSSTVLDIGCGPMRLGSALIPLLKGGWYYGQDINPGTIAFGEEVLRDAGIPEQAPYTLFTSDQFELTPVDRPVQIAFAGRCSATHTEFNIHSSDAASDRASPDRCDPRHFLRSGPRSPLALPILAISGVVSLRPIPTRILPLSTSPASDLARQAGFSPGSHG